MITLFKDPFFNTFDKVFDEAYIRANNRISSNVSTTEDGYKVLLSVPGLSKDDIKISLKENTLTISYDKEGDEFSFTSSFKKSYNVPDDVDEKNITGSVENGIIEILLPKSKKKSVERLISLN
jgi:HSP20 family protein